MAKLDPSISEHLHKDLNVTVDRVRSFGKSSRKVQLEVLARLRATYADQSTAIEIAIAAVAFSLFTFFVRPPEGLNFQEMNWAVGAIIGLLLAATVLVVLIPIFGPQLLRNSRQQHAQVWLAAYEDEIQRRRSRPKK